VIFVQYTARLGNNLFQWAFGRVLSKLSGVPMSALPIPLFPGTYGEVRMPPGKIDFVLPRDSYFANLDEWVEKSKRGNVLVQGYPHNISFFEPHRDWLIGELTPRQGDYTQAGGNDIVLHVRWGDYFRPGNDRYFGYPAKAYECLLSSLEYDRCLIVTDTSGNELAENLVTHLRGQLVAKGVDHDYRTLYHAPRLIISPSTFSWWAAWSGRAAEVYQPYEMGFWKKERNFALDLAGEHVRRFDAEGRILCIPRAVQYGAREL
jgi:hypothetical protein